MNKSILRVAALAAVVLIVGCSSSRSRQGAGVEHVEDSELTTRVTAALIADPITNRRQIDVETVHGTVQLSGFVETADEKAKATEIARSVAGVKNVLNGLSVSQLERGGG